MKVNVLLTPMFLSDAFTEKLVDDNTIVSIREMSGKRLAYGHWFNDDVLDVVVSREYFVRYWMGETDKDGKERFFIEVEHR